MPETPTERQHRIRQTFADLITAKPDPVVGNAGRLAGSVNRLDDEIRRVADRMIDPAEPLALQCALIEYLQELHATRHEVWRVIIHEED
ncbi:hypothetical protein [Acidipropionibacterium acidipropionici]|uniref:hypothetical protein n=1 Tax=Acidipropionibacterium acidipropionici TaxID=1748 RepID=UPI00110A5894|nr:hypothetical protein [Acidipropionibacterium acidipropionici]QCV94318.1 hypothetical protein FEZ30_02715 [Acidipropionibacterium acidipropionici]